MPVVQTVYPNLETLLNLVRVRVNDTFAGITGTAGEGRIYTDDKPWIIPSANAALSKYQRDLDNSGVPTSTREVFFYSLPPINSVLYGPGAPATDAQQNLNYSGFFDGYQNYDTPYLPPDLIAPKEIWYRTANTNLTFSKFEPAPDGLPSVLQNLSPGMWDWRGDYIYWNGSTQSIDIRLRYTNLLQFYDKVDPVDFPNTPLPFRESVDCLAYLMAVEFCEPRLPPGATAELYNNYRREMDKIINRQVRMAQNRKYSRGAFGEDGGGGYGGWGP